MTAPAANACAACRGDTPALDAEPVARLLAQLGRDWRLIDGARLEKRYRFSSFANALSFVNRVGELAEVEAHHPEIHLAWRSVRVTMWTHAVGGLTEVDFTLAGRIERLVDEPAPTGAVVDSRSPDVMRGDGPQRCQPRTQP